MPRPAFLNKPFRDKLPFAFLASLIALLWLAGGASRADAIGQVVTRAGCWAILIAMILVALRPQWRRTNPVALLVFAAIALPALQLVPLPPEVWTTIPGRELLTEAAEIGGQDQPWRPISISPSATLNALSSLIVPLVALLLVPRLILIEHRRIVTMLLGLVLASSLIGLMQFSGAHFDHPMVNDVRGEVSANFANRNHFALFAAIGCLLAPFWAFSKPPHARWKGPSAIGLQLLFMLIILATGSRAGLMVGVLAIVAGLAMVRRQVTQELNRHRPKVAVLFMLAAFGLFAVTVALSVTLGRAVSLQRLLTLDAATDLRRQSLPTVMSMIERYFPVGSGFGTFDPAYRISEPDELLQFAYFNHAHNDWLEVLLDGGLPSLALLVTAMVWWVAKSLRAWRGSPSSSIMFARMGSAVLALVMIASVTDYPARTPIFMAVVVIAAWWLNGVAGSDFERER